MRGKSPEKDNSERYLLTYADLMNLLLILFIVLFSVSKQDVKKTAEVMQAIKNGFNGTTAASASSKASGTGNVSKGSSSATDYSQFFDDLVALLKKDGVYNKVDVSANSNQVVITLKDNVLFQPGRADMNAASVDLMTKMGRLFKNIQFGQIIVEGHTDSDPINTTQFPDNLALSSTRANNVERIFVNCGISQKLIVSAGYGDAWPIAPNTTAANKAKNRRVVITILRKNLAPPDETVATSELISTMQNATQGKLDSSSSSSSSQASSSSKSSSSSKK